MKLSEKRALGKTGLQVPRVIYGTSYLGNLYQELPYSHKLELIHRWFQCTEKPVVIDSAGKYGAGLALEVLGRGLEELGVGPDEVVISNKLGWFRVPLTSDEPTFEPGAWAGLENDCIQSFGYQGILDCFEQGEELLGPRFHSDVVSVHDPDEYLQGAHPRERNRRKEELLASYEALFELKKQGRVKAVGIGSKDWTVIRELYTEVPFDWVMFANSFTIFRHSHEIRSFMDHLDSDGVGIINSAVFHGGFLTGGDKFDYNEVDPDSAFGQKLYAWRKSFEALCRDFGILPADAALHFALSHPAIVSIALNTSKPDKMNRNVEILNQEIQGSFWSALKEKRLIDPAYNYL